MTWVTWSAGPSRFGQLQLNFGFQIGRRRKGSPNFVLFSLYRKFTNIRPNTSRERLPLFSPTSTWPVRPSHDRYVRRSAGSHGGRSDQCASETTSLPSLHVLSLPMPYGTGHLNGNLLVPRTYLRSMLLSRDDLPCPSAGCIMPPYDIGPLVR